MTDVRWDSCRDMRVTRFGLLLLGVAFVVPLTISADQSRNRSDRDDRDCRDSDHHEHNVKTPVGLIGVITVPGNPITSADIAWIDPGTERYYVADRSNFGVDIIDAENDLYEARVVGMAGPLTSGGGTALTNGGGPNGVLVTSKRQLWAGDGNSTTQVADVNPDSPTYLQILHSISTAIPACDTATAHYCGRADELGYDPIDHLILIANNAPLSPTKLCPTVANPLAHCAVDPYATFISANPPYAVLGHIVFPGAVGLEQPLWDAELRRFWLTVPGGVPAGNPWGVPAGNPLIARIDPKTMTAEPIESPSKKAKSIPLDCVKLTGVASASTTGIALAPFQHLLVSACGFPIAVNALTGSNTLITKNVGGGDEVWYNPGDGRFFVTGANTATPPVQQLGVIDAEHGAWLQNVSDASGTFASGKNPSAFPENNHIFTIVQIPAANANFAPPPLMPTHGDPSKDVSVCTQFGFRGTGCIAVYIHAGEEVDEK
jgi:hypothetical protein